MMDIDFDAAAKRFNSDQAKRRQTTLEKKEQQARERAQLQAKRERWEKEAAERREAEMKKQAAEAEQRDIDLERNRGVAFFRTGLRPQLSRTAELKGIRRANDKISLPPSCKAELEMQHASKNGLLYFVLSMASGRRTCASILDFSAPEGTIDCPASVLKCLGLGHVATGHPAAVAETVDVRYTVLKTGTFARVQPVLSAFAADVSDVKATLEAEMLRRTTLSTGDTLRVREFSAAAVVADGSAVVADGSAVGADGSAADAAAAGGVGAGGTGGITEYELKIVALEPDEFVSLIDTDLSVEVLPSVQAEEAAAAEARAQAERQRKLDEAIEAKRQQEAAAAESQAEAERAAAAAAAAALERRVERRLRAAAALPAEPDASDMDAISVAVRCPDGTRVQRRFLRSAPLAALFGAVEASAYDGLPEGDSFTLALSYPRRVFRRADAADGSRSLLDAGLAGRQEALFVELVTTGEAMEVQVS
jgi:ubiquitin fusion degradation protein 1